MAAAQVLARLANEPWLRQLAGAFAQPLPRSEVPGGITGDILLAQATSYGMIVIAEPDQIPMNWIIDSH